MAFEFTFFRKIAQSQWQTLTVYGILIACCIGTILLSLFQVRSKTRICSVEDCPTDVNFCKNEMIRLISPFSLTLANGFHVECGWPPNNTTLRIISCAVLIVSSILMVIVVLRNKITSETVFGVLLLKYVFFISLFLIYVILVLDCNGLRNGHKGCNENFIAPDSFMINFYFYAYTTISSCRVTPYLWIVFLDVSNVIFNSFAILLTILYHEHTSNQLSKEPNASIQNTPPADTSTRGSIHNTTTPVNSVNSVNTVNGNTTTNPVTTTTPATTTAPAAGTMTTTTVTGTTEGVGGNDDDENPFELDDDDDDENPFPQ